MPSTSPMAQPIRQCTVAEMACWVTWSIRKVDIGTPVLRWTVPGANIVPPGGISTHTRARANRHRGGHDPQDVDSPVRRAPLRQRGHDLGDRAAPSGVERHLLPNVPAG